MIDHNENVPLSGLADLLCQEGHLDTQSMQAAIQQAERQTIALTTYLVKNKLINSQNILTVCLKYFNLPYFDLQHYDPAWLESTNLKIEMIYRYHVIPFKQCTYFLEIGTADPTNQKIFSAISFHTGLTIKLVLVAENLLDELINIYYQKNILHSNIKNTLLKLDRKNNLTNDEKDEPVMHFVNQLLKEAIEKNISDIHLEPFTKHCRIRFRRDGLLYEAASLPISLANRVMTRLKIMANLNIAERRLPQDGHITEQFDSKTDIRLNSCPALFGEKMVLRLLQADKTCKNIHALGLTSKQMDIFLDALHKPHGLILITGPTGSGKTISLYAALHHLNKIEKNILTVEDPVEIVLPGVTQININQRIGLEFATTLRAILRQDPDIIMIGEIRDKETAQIAVQAAQTGHLVLSTLHANSALETLSRLQMIGISLDQMTASLSLIMAQRLVRKLCKNCLSHYQKINCQQCHHGYQGRIGIFECISINDELIKLLLDKQNIFTIENILKKQGTLFLFEAGLEKVDQGVTDYAELARVVIH